MKILIFLIIIFNCYAYVLRSDVTGRVCILNKSLLIKFDKNLCNYNFNYFNPFNYNNCLYLKKDIKNGLEMWSKNNENINLIFNDKLDNTIPIYIKNTKIDQKTIGYAKSYCLKKRLINAEINLNIKRCFYPDFFFCRINPFLLILIFSLVIILQLLVSITLPMCFNLVIIFVILIELCLCFFFHINCEKCSPLRNVIAHEFGHILGFGHPDQYNYFNRIATYQNCKINSIIDNKYDQKSIMLSTDNILRFKNKISYDDWLGLYDLYPSCITKYFSFSISYINDNNSFITILSICLLMLPFMIFFLFHFFNKFK